MAELIKRFLNKETISYLFFGGVTTAVNYLIYYGCLAIGIHFLIANVIAWIVAVITAFITNKFFVFESKDMSRKTLFREALLFAEARVLSLLLEEGFLELTVEVFDASEKIMKLVAAVFVVIINYFFSKLIIFRKGGHDNVQE